MRLVFRALEGHTASVSILIYLERSASGRAYKNEIEYEMHIQAPTAVRTLKFLCDIGLVMEVPGAGGVRHVRRMYALTEKGKKIAEIIDQAERGLEEMRDAGALYIDGA